MSVFSGPLVTEPHEEDEASPAVTLRYDGQKLWVPMSMAVRWAKAILDLDSSFRGASSSAPDPANPKSLGCEGAPNSPEKAAGSVALPEPGDPAAG